MTDKTLAALATEFYETDRPIGTVLDQPTVIQQAVVAARKYAAHGYVSSLLPPAPPDPAPPPQPSEYELSLLDQYYFPPIYGWPLYPVVRNTIIPGTPLAPVDWLDENTVVTQGEWGFIRPLFMLYVEREQSIQLEASRNLGVDVYGRSTSEIDQDIARAEGDIPERAFLQPVISV